MMRQSFLILAEDRSPATTLGTPLVSPRFAGGWACQQIFASWLESLGRWLVMPVCPRTFNKFVCGNVGAIPPRF